jgi:hypothetical protein
LSWILRSRLHVRAVHLLKSGIEETAAIELSNYTNGLSWNLNSTVAVVIVMHYGTENMGTGCSNLF